MRHCISALPYFWYNNDLVKQKEYRDTLRQEAFKMANQCNQVVDIVAESNAFNILDSVSPNITTSRCHEVTLPLKQLEQFLDEDCVCEFTGESEIRNHFRLKVRLKEVLLMNFRAIIEDKETLLQRVNALEKELKTLQNQYISHQSDHG